MKQYVYKFEDGKSSMRNLLGGKGANLSEMTGLGMPVPPGFTISTEACTQYYDDGCKINANIEKQIFDALTELEKRMGKKLGEESDPLLVSVRSGARASMPGMMDTILNLGLNDKSVEGIAKKTGNSRFAYDSYRRFIQMFSDVVMEQDKSVYERILDEIKKKKGYKSDPELTTDDLKEIVTLFKNNYKKNQGTDFPQEPRKQLLEATKAVFRSWDNPRANVYRRMNDIPYDWGTAVNIQSMVFGNKGETSGTGVAFTRNPATGEKGLFGEYLMNAQGEDVVAGTRTPKHISELRDQNEKLYNEFVAIAERLEEHYRDMQDMEFTIEEGKLYMLQTRNGKRTAQAALKIAVDLVAEGMIDKKKAVCMIDPKQLDTLLHPQFDAKAMGDLHAASFGLPASPGAACGKIAFNADEAVARVKNGEKVILVRLETSPEDIEGMNASEGILTARGGMTSHAAVVARGMGVCCVSGCSDLAVDEENKKIILAGQTYGADDWLSLDGTTGNIYTEKIPTVPAEVTGDFDTLMSWADSYRTLNVRTNSDTPADAAQAIRFGAEGIGLCRTEHMFFDPARIPAIREMIVSKTVEERERALSKLLPMQKGDFKAMYIALEGRPMTVRFLDPPLHEFVPHEDWEIIELSKNMGLPYDELRTTIVNLHESNPMMGHRGCRLSVTYPEIARMQTRAVIEAALEVRKEKGWDIVPEIMIPLVGDVKELKYVKSIVCETANNIIKEQKSDMKYLVGTMIEIPRAAVTADKIAEEAEFFSFGTNDLTQLTFGFSRDDAGKFLPEYYNKKIYESDPFARVDPEGVGSLIQIAVEKGRSVRSNIKLGVCGEHGGDPSSVEFFHRVGLHYVSCSPFRVPIARLAAAQAAIKYAKE